MDDALVDQIDELVAEGVVASRSEAVRVALAALLERHRRARIAAPVTRTVRGIVTEIGLGPDEGLSQPCVASFDNLQPIRRTFLTERAGRLGPARRLEICSALAALSDC